MKRNPKKFIPLVHYPEMRRLHDLGMDDANIARIMGFSEDLIATKRRQDRLPKLRCKVRVVG